MIGGYVRCRQKGTLRFFEGGPEGGVGGVVEEVAVDYAAEDVDAVGEFGRGG